MATAADHELSSSPLARSAASGVRWTTLAGGITAGLNLVQTLVVARLLNPSDFGLMASAMVVVTLGGAFADAGLASAIVARPTTRRTLSSLYWLNILMGAAVCAALIAAAPLVSDFYNEPRLTGIVRLAAVIFLVAPVGQQFAWLLEKELRFRPLGVVQIVAAVAGTVVAITAAALGSGVYALIFGMLTTGAVSAVAFVMLGWRRWRPMLRLRWIDVRGYLDFGLYQMGERTITYLAANVDYILIGRFLGPAALGTYSIAYQLVIKPVIYINPMLNRVAFPVLATRQHDDQALRRGYLHVVRLIAYVTVPLMAGLSVLAPDFVAVVLGDGWSASAPILAVLCGVGLLRSLANPVGSVLLAKNRPDVGFKGNLVMLVVMTAVLLVAAHKGLTAVAWASLGVTLAAFLAWLLVLRALVGLSLREYWHAVRSPVGYAVVMTAAVLVVGAAASAADAGSATGLVLGTATGALVYAALIARFDAGYVRDLWRLFRSRAATT